MANDREMWATEAERGRRGALKTIRSAYFGRDMFRCASSFLTHLQIHSNCTSAVKAFGK
jgi:hypothetical protein